MPTVKSRMACVFKKAYEFNQPLDNWDLSRVTSMTSMLATAKTFHFNQPLGSWNVFRVQIMVGMFNNVNYVNQPLGSWGVHRVTSMASMSERTSLNSPLDLGMSLVSNSWLACSEEMLSSTRHFQAGAYRFDQPLDLWEVPAVWKMAEMLKGTIDTRIHDGSPKQRLDLSAGAIHCILHNDGPAGDSKFNTRTPFD
eukprot:jgi/Psemu1/8488/gm1.8488_g